jgi:hypothetical protein
LRRGWAATRWVGLVVACGLGVAAAFGILFVVLETLIAT